MGAPIIDDELWAMIEPHGRLDANYGVTLSASTGITFTEDAAQRFEAYGWHTHLVEDGNDLPS